jgi:thiol-disulfide isomerase/thioredoxin
MMTDDRNNRRPGVVGWSSRLLVLCLAVSLWGCDDNPRRRGMGGGELSPAEVIAILLEENEPFEFDFDLDDVNGNHLSKANFAGKVLIVDLWGTWCDPCRMEVPHFVALNRQYADQGLRVIGMNDESRGSIEAEARIVRKYCEANGVDYPCAILTRRIKQQVPGYGTFPMTLFLDRTGKVRLRLMGYHDLSYLQAAVEALLKESAPGANARPDQSGESNGPGKTPAAEN